MASTPRIYDKQSEEWKDGDALFLRCTIWRESAEKSGRELDLMRADIKAVAGGSRMLKHWRVWGLPGVTHTD